eukprot:1126837-Pelagomonas_calceolata.AAC.4
MPHTLCPVCAFCICYDPHTLPNTLRPTALPIPGAHAIPQDLHPDGVLRDAHQQLCGVILLELRRSLPAAAAPSSGCA